MVAGRRRTQRATSQAPSHGLSQSPPRSFRRPVRETPAAVHVGSVGRRLQREAPEVGVGCFIPIEVLRRVPAPARHAGNLEAVVRVEEEQFSSRSRFPERWAKYASRASNESAVPRIRTFSPKGNTAASSIDLTLRSPVVTMPLNRSNSSGSRYLNLSGCSKYRRRLPSARSSAAVSIQATVQLSLSAQGAQERVLQVVVDVADVLMLQLASLIRRTIARRAAIERRSATMST